MTRPQRQGQSGLAVGMYWAVRISSIGFEMAVPPVIGFWLDGLWGTTPWLVIIGACLGFALAMLNVFKLAQEQRKTGTAAKPPRTNGTET